MGGDDEGLAESGGASMGSGRRVPSYMLAGAGRVATRGADGDDAELRALATPLAASHAP